MALINRGFRRCRPLAPELAERLPPGQHLVADFPALSIGPTPRTRLEDWALRIDGSVEMPQLWTWDQFWAVPSRRFETDIHCVTSWCKLGTVWEGVRSTLCWMESRRALATSVPSAMAAYDPTFRSLTPPTGKRGSPSSMTTSRCPRDD
jgi:hypothetical protein